MKKSIDRKVQLEYMLEMLEVPIINAERPNPMSIPKSMTAKGAKSHQRVNEEHGVNSIIKLIKLSESIFDFDASIPHELSHWLLHQFVISCDRNQKDSHLVKAVKKRYNNLDSALESLSLSQRIIIFILRIQTIIYAYYEEIETITQPNEIYIHKLESFQIQEEIEKELRITFSEYQYGKMLAHMCFKETSRSLWLPPPMNHIETYFAMVHGVEGRTVRNWFESCQINSDITRNKPSIISIKKYINATDYTDIIPV